MCTSCLPELVTCRTPSQAEGVELACACAVRRPADATSRRAASTLAPTLVRRRPGHTATAPNRSTSIQRVQDDGFRRRHKLDADFRCRQPSSARARLVAVRVHRGCELPSPSHRCETSGRRTASRPIRRTSPPSSSPGADVVTRPDRLSMPRSEVGVRRRLSIRRATTAHSSSTTPCLRRTTASGSSASAGSTSPRRRAAERSDVSPVLLAARAKSIGCRVEKRRAHSRRSRPTAARDESSHALELTAT